jgi:glyoxylase-like metal-dependent hydrolase (beta-lactamase superfamily II)
MKTNKISLKIGNYQLHSIPTGIFALDGGAMFGTVPKVLWEKSNPADNQNRIPMEARALLLKSADRNILIDCGNGADFIAKYGEKLGSKFEEIYQIQKDGNSLLKSLEKQNLRPEDIDAVILTHLHFDHAGGATTAKEGKLVPTFPKATYYLQKANYETALNPNLREKASYFPANFQPLLDHSCLTFLEGETEIFPGISCWISNGHTKGHQMIFIQNHPSTSTSTPNPNSSFHFNSVEDDSAVLYCGDVVPTSSHIRLPWVMGYDLNPLLLIEEKANYLQKALAKNTYLFFEHDPYCDLASFQKNGSDFSIKERWVLE